MTLYELTNELQELLALAEDPEMDPQMIQDTLEGLEGEIEVKAEGYGKVIAQMKADALALKGEIDRLSARKKTIEGNVDRITERLKMAMITMQKDKIETPLFKFTIRKNPPKLVVDADPEGIPAAYWIPQEPKLDSAKLKEDVKNGDKFALTIAHLEQGESLSIK